MLTVIFGFVLEKLESLSELLARIKCKCSDDISEIEGRRKIAGEMEGA